MHCHHSTPASPLEISIDFLFLHLPLPHFCLIPRPLLPLSQLPRSGVLLQGEDRCKHRSRNSSESHTVSEQVRFWTGGVRQVLDEVSARECSCQNVCVDDMLILNTWSPLGTPTLVCLIIIRKPRNILYCHLKIIRFSATLSVY